MGERSGRDVSSRLPNINLDLRILRLDEIHHVSWGGPTFRQWYVGTSDLKSASLRAADDLCWRLQLAGVVAASGSKR